MCGGLLDTNGLYSSKHVGAMLNIDGCMPAAG